MPQTEHNQQVLDRLDHMTESVIKLDRSVEKMNGRLRALELWKARMEGMAAAHRWLMPIVASITSALVSSGLLIILTSGGAHPAH